MAQKEQNKVDNIDLSQLSEKEKRDLILSMRRLSGKKSSQKMAVPTTDDELWWRIKNELGDEIPRVAVCEDHCAPFDFACDFYFERERALLVCGARESGKCIEKDSLVYDPVTGLRSTIAEVVDNDYIKKIVSMTKDGYIRNVDIGSKLDTGEKDCLEVTLLSGRKIIVTPEHPFMIQDGWYRADEIEVGDAVATPAFLPYQEVKKEIPDSHLILISGLLAEGSINEADKPGRGIQFSSGDEYFINLMTDCAEEVGCNVNYNDGYDYTISRKVGGPRSNQVKEMLIEYGVDFTLAKYKKVPDIIFEVGEEQLCEFLSIFWMCDGFILKGQASMTLASKKMLEDIQHLLLKLKIQSRIRYCKTKWNEKYYDAWELSIYGSCIERFSECINLWGYKKDKLDALVAKDRCPSAGRPPISGMMMEKFKNDFPRRSTWDTSHKVRNREAYEQLGWKVEKGFGVSSLIRGKVKNLQTRRLKALCHAHNFDENKFSILLNKDLWWDFVTDIKEVGKKRIYDLIIPDNESFIANDIVVHNTRISAIVNYINADTKPGVSACVFADIEAQSNKSYSYIRDFVYTKDDNDRKVLKSSIEGDPLRKETKWKNGSFIEVIIGSKSGVNSPHTQKVIADEVDLMEEEIFMESRSISSSKTLPDGTVLKAQDIATSTRKTNKGLMQKLIDEIDKAKKNGHIPPWKLYIFCVFENSQEVSNCRRAPQEDREKRLKELDKDSCELCECNKIVKSEWAGGAPRTLETICKGKFFKSRGWMRYADIVGKFTQNSPQVWVAQMECRRPMADGLYLPTWSRERYVCRGYEPRPEYGYIWQGVDWGGSQNSAVTWIQGPLHQPLQVNNTIGTTTVIPQGAYVVFDELNEASMGATRLADKVVRKEIYYKNRYGSSWRVKARFADKAGRQQREDWREHNPPLRTMWYLSGAYFDPTVECVQSLVADSLLYVDDKQAPGLCDDFESWRQRDGREIHDSSSHGPASLRYCLKNVAIIVKRYKKESSANNLDPIVVGGNSGGSFPGAASAGGVDSDLYASERWRQSFTGQPVGANGRGGKQNWEP